MKITKDQLRAKVSAKTKPEHLVGGCWVDPPAETAQTEEAAIATTEKPTC